MTNDDLIAVPRGILAAANYIIRQSAHANSKTAKEMKRLALAAPAPVSARDEALDGYRAAVSFIGSDAWDGCPDCMEILRAARTLDTDWDWAGDPDRIAKELKRVRARNLKGPSHD